MFQENAETRETRATVSSISGENRGSLGLRLTRISDGFSRCSRRKVAADPVIFPGRTERTPAGPSSWIDRAPASRGNNQLENHLTRSDSSHVMRLRGTRPKPRSCMHGYPKHVSGTRRLEGVSEPSFKRHGTRAAVECSELIEIKSKSPELWQNRSQIGHDEMDEKREEES